MRALRTLLAAAALVSVAAAPVRAQDAGWAALAQRIAGHDPSADLSIVLGAEPPGFLFPLPERPLLPVLGSTYFASRKNAPPLLAHIYYAPTSHTGTASESLFAQLRAAGYTRVSSPNEVAPLFGGAGTVQHMCPRNLQQPAIDVTIKAVDGLPALDLAVTAPAETTLCHDGLVLPEQAASMPDLIGISGLAFRWRIGPPWISRPSPIATATVRTDLAPRDAVAKLAERFVAKGWQSREPTVTDQTITQRFTRAMTGRTIEALLALDRRAKGVYTVLLAFSDRAAGVER